MAVAGYVKGMVAVEELKLSYHISDTISRTIYPEHGNLKNKFLNSNPGM